ncbi:helix-hairpin-helix domain-containing protein [Haloarcula sp. S1CR25-12]|uniref:Helix-hairpin-helix domain-containing protein n=1 Tax=Haloarcula saliterrae TaxID=2950534 RepID=A0ABU2F775_9EURY|nr:helix-hairpin-helix domain-containing protein [Haloarcula sp. S1CR25-12]MDS0258120.1 helix-hairpin-helix domain-containing protein [Haloarcula sp. S1CR25-12]
MGLLQKLKSALGLNGAESSEAGHSDDVDVTVEREPSTEGEDAVKGTDTASSAGSATETPDESATETDDAPSADEFETVAESDEFGDATTDGESADAETADDGTDETAEGAGAIEEAEPDDAESTEPDRVDGDDAAEGSSDPVTELNGIGPAYGDRLAGAGIETVGELAVADAADVADRIDLGESRVADWVEQAKTY